MKWPPAPKLLLVDYYREKIGLSHGDQMLRFARVERGLNESPVLSGPHA